ncbi:MAG: LysR family transcriptional regulator [Kiloniellales bacterium]
MLMSWDDLRVFFAVAEQGSLSAAARLLGMSQPTVGRRIEALEASLARRLFDRQARGYELTAAGAALLPIARPMAKAAAVIIHGKEAKEPEGSVRIVLDEWMTRFLSQNIAGLLARQPGLRIELATAERETSLSRSLADLAIRDRPPESDAWAGRAIARRAHAVYGAPAYLVAEPAVASEARYERATWIDFEEEERPRPSARWLAARRGRRAPTLRCDRAAAILEAAKDGAGLAILPCYIGDGEPGLKRLGGPIPNLTETAWLVARRDQLKRPAARGVADWMAALLRRHTALFAGEALRG